VGATCRALCCLGQWEDERHPAENSTTPPPATHPRAQVFVNDEEERTEECFKIRVRIYR